ncbi:MAG: RHS repeat-associated core domain-containing protein [Bacteroidales bacterium]|jgi:RHS repeat-associated protein|nr:RHS repeat-associated core domain-containing protein [Bacteroidales bacterium]
MQRAERPCPHPLRASRKASEKKSFLWDEENRLLAVNNNGSVSCYFYDAAGERTVKLTSESEMVHVNGKKVGGNANVSKFTAYVSPYFVVSNGGAYTKHIYAASQRIASKLGNEDGFGADPRRVEQAGGLKKTDNLATTIKARYESLGIDYEEAKKEEVLPDSTMDSEEPENLVFFYHPDHLGSTSYVTDADGNIAQHIEYIPYGEVFVEERNNQFSTNFLFNAKELDNETGLYYYGARYLDPTGAMWLSADPLFEKYAGMSPYNYCAGNPVVMVDPDGRSVEEESKIEWNQNVAEIEKKRDEISSILANSKLKKSEYRSLKQREIYLNTKLQDLRRIENDDTQMYKLNKLEGGVGSVSKDMSTGVVMINYTDIANFVHETTHVTQYQNGEIGFHKQTGQAVLKDVYDEIQAYKYELAFSGVQKMSVVNEKWISNIVDPNGKYLYDMGAGYAPIKMNKNSKMSDFYKICDSNPNIAFLLFKDGMFKTGGDKRIVDYFNYDVR